MSNKKNKKKIKREKRKQKKSKVKSGKIHLLNKLKRANYLPGKMKIVESPDKEKMSEVILDFAKPLLEECAGNNELIKKAVTIAIIVWNISLLPEKDHNKAVQDISSKLAPSKNASDYVVMMSYIDMLMERKKKYFSNNRRAIISYHFSDVQGGIHLDLASTLPPL
ncbi:MAG: hypothetical protein QME42_00635 [bacterium]|nr:hypothetical protein [bacterium]